MADNIAIGQFDDVEENITEVLPTTVKNTQQESSNNQEMHVDDNEYYDDYDSYEDDDWWDDHQIKKQYNSNHGNVSVNQKNSTNKQKSTLQPQEKQFGKFVNKIKIEKYEGPAIDGRAHNQLVETSKKQYTQTVRVKDRKDRATVEQVLDPRTKMILFKLLNKGIINQINGCISTGKEANVYHASTADGLDRALKIYKTSILVFKDRDKYVNGEYRFRHGYCKGNPRKMVKTWAEKEMRNLARLRTAGIPCPEPIILRSHVLVMDFIGHQGWAAPRLKDANFSDSKARELYLTCVRIMRMLFWKARLVHADLSEFNILYNIEEDQLYIIDVSQSVEHDHPSALLFLRKDCTNINDFFRKRNVCVMSLQELFNFVTDPLITEENIEEYLERAQEITSTRTHGEITSQEMINEEVFKQAFIPRTLDEVIDYERDSKKAKEGNDKDLFYANIIGLNKNLTGTKLTPDILNKQLSLQKNDKEMENSNGMPPLEGDESESECEKSDEDSHTDDGNSSWDEEEEETKERKKELRKEHKKFVKEENRKKREEKMPKHVKKRKEKVTKGKGKH